MTVYFCFDDLLDAVLDEEGKARPLDTLIPVSTEPPDCGGHREDAIVLASQPRLLDLNDPRGVYQLASLLEDVPLYQINLELLLDDALSQRHLNRLIEKAMTKAFEGQPLPNTLSKEDMPRRETLDGSLAHPMIGHLDKTVLSKIYINFMRALPHGQEGFGFEDHVLGRHIGPFCNLFSGYILGSKGKVRADILIGFGNRADFDSKRHVENYVENGRSQAMLMRIQEKNELLWAWLEADNYQMRRCHDIDRMFSLTGLPRLPNWTRSDIFRCLEKEAMKQALAIRLIEADPALKLLPRQTQIRAGIEASASGQIDEGLQQLLGQTLTSGIPYSGSAARFYARAQDRAREARTL